MTREVIILFYSVQVRFLLKYCVHFGALHFDSNIDALVSNHRRKIRMMQSLENVTYEKKGGGGEKKWEA